MDEYFNISKGLGFIHVQDFKTLSPSGINQFFLKVPDAARNSGTGKVLVDGRTAEGSFSTMQQYEYGSMLAKHFKGIQVAIVVQKSLRDPTQFGETVALNRGAKVRVFTDLEAAKSWLGMETKG
jgi:hypothetical protein